MRADERRDAGVWAGTAAGEIAELTRDVHRAVARRVFGVIGPIGRPVQLLHDGIADIAYGSTGLGVRALPRIAGLVAGAAADPLAVSVHETRRGRLALGAVNGYLGDRLSQADDAVAVAMRVRVGDGPLRRDPANAAHDAARRLRGGDTAITGRLVVFVHGLCESDLCWSYAAASRWGDPATTYGSKLAADDGWTPLYLSYNSGRHISDNGRELTDLLERLVADWPVAVADIAIVGHSMGGLVARSAAQQGAEAGAEWVTRLRHVVGLGVPHLGAPLERFANWGTHQLARLPESRPFAQWLNRRSAGIKDLRYGALLEADWSGHDPDDLLADHCTPSAFVPGVTYSAVSATLSAAPDGPFAHDLLVQHGSAHALGRVRSLPFESTQTLHVGGGKHHFDLLADARVYAALRGWLADCTRGSDDVAAGPAVIAAAVT